METDVTTSASLFKLWAWFEANKKQVAWGAVAVVGVGLLGWFFVWQQGEKELTASEALASISLPQATGAPAPAETASSYLKIAADYPNSSAGARAVLQAGASLFVEGKYAEAQAQFAKFAREHHDSPFMGTAQLGIAACYDAQGKTNDAVTAYDDLVHRHPSENVVPQAKFALGRLYEAQGKYEQARNSFEEVARVEASSSLGSEAGMRLEELRLKHPSVFAPPYAAPAVSNQQLMPTPIPSAGASSNAAPGKAAPVKPEKP
jgi:predicted negative regulator of RcsB-dependent stress response